MSTIADYLVDRRRLKRRLRLWQLAAVLFLLVAGLVIAGRLGDLARGSHVARLFVEGIIVDDWKRDEALSKVEADDRARALIVHINSPGGTVVGGEALFARLRQVAEKKPVVAVMGEMATSAAYMTALGADRIFARDGTITGSIGVIMQTADVTDLLGRLGIKPETIKSSPLKAQPNPLEPFSAEARVVTQKVVRDIYDIFVQMVADRRGLAREQLTEVADGRVFTGHEARDRGLIDAIGGERDALVWLSEAKQLPASLPVRTIELGGTEEELRDLINGVIGKSLFPEILRLDGLVSVWHPAL